MNARFKPPTLEYAISVLTLAFGVDPPTRWVFSDPYDYVRYFPEFVRALGGGAFEHHTAASLDGCAAVALWLPPGARPDEEALVGLIQRAVSQNLLGDC
jgi:hypothetical protein